MNIVKILCGILLVGMATFVHGGSQSDKRCAKYQPDWPLWQEYAPERCKPWSGCSNGDMATSDLPEGRCTGAISAEIDDVTSVYTVFSCEPISNGPVYKCKDFVGTKCVNDGLGVCLTYKVYYDANCNEGYGLPSAEWTQPVYKCYTDISGG